MFRTLICPSSGACDYNDGLPHRLPCSVKTDVFAISVTLRSQVCTVQSQTHILSTSKIDIKYQIINETHQTQTYTMNTITYHIEINYNTPTNHNRQ